MDFSPALVEGLREGMPLTLIGQAPAAGRLGLQDAMREAMIAAVEQSLGRQVFSFMSANDLHRNLQIEVFVLHPNGR